MRLIDADALLETFAILAKKMARSDAQKALMGRVLYLLEHKPEVVVRCKDCKWFVPKHIRLDDGSTREYTEEEKKLPLGVPGNVGINCGSKCMRHISWLENSVPVWVQENDYCSYGERKEVTP